jgi:hypothetical protein
MVKASFWTGPMEERLQAKRMARVAAGIFLAFSLVLLTSVFHAGGKAGIASVVFLFLLMAVPALLLGRRFSILACWILGGVCGFAAVVSFGNAAANVLGPSANRGLAVSMLVVGLVWVFLFWLSLRGRAAARFLRRSGGASG